MLQEFDLAQGALGQDFLAEDIGDFLDGNTLVGLIINSSTIRRLIVVSYFVGILLIRCSSRKGEGKGNVALHTKQYHKLPGRAPS